MLGACIQEGFARAGSCILWKTWNLELEAFTDLDRGLTELLWSSFTKWETGPMFGQISASTHVQHRIFCCLAGLEWTLFRLVAGRLKFLKIDISTEVWLGESWKPDSVAFLFVPFFARKEKSGWQCVLNIGCQAGWRVQTSPIRRKAALNSN